MPLTAEDLVGAWDLIDFHITFEDGRPPLAPFGDGARGRIIYSADGRMSAVLSAADRAPLSVDALERSAAAPDAEKAAAFDSYLSYAGTFRIEGDRVVHLVELALMPNIIGREQVRHASLDGDELTLSYDVEAKSGARRYTLRWRRA